MSDKFDDFFLRIEQVIGDRRKGKPGLLPMCRTKWYNGVSAGEFPRPIKVGRLSLWRASDIKALLDRLAA